MPEMPNGHDKNWVRVCGAVDGFRQRFGRWPVRVRVMPGAIVDLVDSILTPAGFAVVNSKFELVAEEDAEMTAEGPDDETYCYGTEGFPTEDVRPSTFEYFGQAILRPEPPVDVGSILGWDAEGNPVTPGAKKVGKIDPKNPKRSLQ